MVTSLANVKHGIEVCSLTAARQHSSHTSFKLGNLLCHNIIGWVLQTSVEIALLFQVEEHGHLLRVVILKRGALNNRRLYRLTVFSLIASVNTDGSCM